MRRIVAFHVRPPKNEGELAFIVIRLYFHDGVVPLGKFLKKGTQPTVDSSVCVLASLGRNGCDEGIPDKGHEEQTHADQFL